MKKVLKVIVCIILILASLYWLNGTVFAFWAAGGPPTDRPEYFVQMGITRFCVSCIIGVLAFLVTREFKDLFKSKLNISLMLLCLVLAVYPAVRKYVVIDACLDNGGAWDNAKFTCKNA